MSKQSSALEIEVESEVILTAPETFGRKCARYTRNVGLAVGSAYVAGSTAMAAAAVDSGVQNAIDSFDLTFTAVKTVVLTILVFAVGYKLAKRWLKG